MCLSCYVPHKEGRKETPEIPSVLDISRELSQSQHLFDQMCPVLCLEVVLSIGNNESDVALPIDDVFIDE